MTRPTSSTLRTVWARDLSRCFRCMVILHHGRGGYSVHHRKPRGMGGSKDPAINTAANLLLLCGSGVDGCHGWVETNREQAIDLGYLISRLSDRPPDTVPVKRWGVEWVLLDADGSLTLGVDPAPL